VREGDAPPLHLTARVDDGGLTLVAGLLLMGALFGSLIAERLRLPGLLLFLLVGVAVGWDGAGWVRLDDLELARRIGVLALALILFEGGLSAPVAALRRVLRPALLLAVAGTIATALLTGVAAAVLLGCGLVKGLLVGATLASTDGAAVFALLRGSSLPPRLALTLEAEAGFNDPVAVLLVLGFTTWLLRPGYGVPDMLLLFVRQLGLGLVCGAAVGVGAARLLERVRLPAAGLYPVASLAVAGLAFGSADVLHGSGFLAVYVAGLALAASRDLPAQGTLSVFNDGLAWVAQVALFLTLGLLIVPSQLATVAGAATALALFLAFVARPAAVWAVTLLEDLGTRERLLLGWAGLRGGVPIVLATFPVIADVPGSRRVLEVAFFVVVFSTVLQGMTFESVARRLGLAEKRPLFPRALRETGTASRLGAELAEYRVGPDDRIVGRRLADLPLPPEATVMVIVRGDEAIPPKRGTRIETGDQVHVLVREESAGALATSLDIWQHGERDYRQDAVRPRPWTAMLGDPAHPVRVAGLAVVEHVRVRADVPGALVVLEDGRYALTGPALLVGERTALRRYADERLRRARAAEAGVWWRDVLDALGD
jgi:cell volume regulation protein A